MTGQIESLQTVFTKNRAEELGQDVWKNFVVPPFFDKLDLRQARKPRMIIGGRGCGKTMLLRYLSHQSAFSTDRPKIPNEELEHIGLYWRADTQFARMMWGRNVEDDIWSSAFDHLLALVLGLQILKSVHSIARSNCDAFGADSLGDVSFKVLSAFDAEMKGKLDEVQEIFDVRLKQFEVWVANVRRGVVPTFLPGTKFLSGLIEELKTQLPALNEATYFVYIDEYENLHEHQQRIVNTYLKHSEMPLIFNVAVKRHGMVTTKTVGEESIVDIADYRTHDLEDYLLDGDFPAFAAEVLYLNLAIAKVGSVPIEPQRLRDPGLLDDRRREEYRSHVLTHARSLLPGLTHEQLAQAVFADSTLKSKLKERFQQALKSRASTLDADQFLRPEWPQASITALALTYRQRLTPEDVLKELDQLERGESNRFTGSTNWVHNNFIGSLLSLYESHSKAALFYAGFDTFCSMSRGNLRHFRELCHKSLNSVSKSLGALTVQVPPADQAAAARQTSASFLGEVRSFGRLGNPLHAFVLRLGSLFALAQRSRTQSEPERSHFAIVRGQAVSPDDREFLQEAIKWSVLFAVEETKLKDQDQASNFEYVLNPIYAPYFGITYRKRRKIELSTEEFRTLRQGGYDEVSALIKKYAKNWTVDLPKSDVSLFGHLVEVEPA